VCASNHQTYRQTWVPAPTVSSKSVSVCLSPGCRLQRRCRGPGAARSWPTAGGGTARAAWRERDATAPWTSARVPGHPRSTWPAIGCTCSYLDVQNGIHSFFLFGRAEYGMAWTLVSRRRLRAGGPVIETSRMHLVPFDKENRTLGPHLAANNSILSSATRQIL
jgi:hypothetical protein